MKQIIIIVTAFILNLLPAAWATSDKIQWQAYSSNIFEQAKSIHRPILLLSKSNSCHWCQQMESTTFSNPTVIKLINRSYLPVVIEINRNRDIFIQYKIIRLPTTLILDTNGNIIKVATGYIQPNRMIKILKIANKRT